MNRILDIFSNSQPKFLQYYLAKLILIFCIGINHGNMPSIINNITVLSILLLDRKFKIIFCCTSGVAWSPSWSAGNAFLAEFGSLHLEFEALAHHLNDRKYYDAVERVNDAMLAADTSTWGGLFPSQYHPDTGRFTNGTCGKKRIRVIGFLIRQFLMQRRILFRVLLILTNLVSLLPY